MKFDFSKSNDSDLQNKITLKQLDIMASNILYLTHEVDKILKMVTKLDNSLNLQKQVDDYFTEDSKQTEEETTI